MIENKRYFKEDFYNEYAIKKEDIIIAVVDSGSNARRICNELNALYEENEQLKKELLFFYDVANCECSTNWRKDMEKGCKRFFNCTYEEAKEKYGDYDGMWWEIND